MSAGIILHSVHIMRLPPGMTGARRGVKRARIPCRLRMHNKTSEQHLRLVLRFSATFMMQYYTLRITSSNPAKPFWHSRRAAELLRKLLLEAASPSHVMRRGAALIPGMEAGGEKADATSAAMSKHTVPHLSDESSMTTAFLVAGPLSWPWQKPF